MAESKRSPKNDSSRSERLRELIASRAVLGKGALERAVADATVAKVSLAEHLESSGAVPPATLLELLGEVYGVPYADLSTTFGDPLILDSVPKAKAFEFLALPLFSIERQLTVAMPDPDNLAKLDALRFLTAREILPCVALAGALRTRLAECYGDPSSKDDSAPLSFEATAGESEREAAAEEAGYTIDSDDGGQPVVRLLNLALMRAIEEGASDIHIEPYDASVAVRFRVDGHLQVKPFTIPASIGPALTSRIKILASLDITEHRVPQDGKIRVRFANRPIDIRVSTFPTIRGEKVVMRLLDKDRMNFRLESIGMSDPVLTGWRDLIRRREGILLATGPTGSGKSSTLYATLRALHEPEVNIITLEDPVEYELEGLAQAQVNDLAGFTFAKGLRSILRQDPDIILVGEIRDQETAQIAAQAAMTGHLVLATLHTNDAASTITRLTDIGLPPYLVSAALLGVVAQRLLRRLCPHCTRETEPTADERRYLEPWLDQGVPFLTGEGCPSCLGRGYRGRTGVHELLPMTSDLRGLISRSAAAGEVSAQARVHGFRSLWADGLGKVREGATSLRELSRVIERDFATLTGGQEHPDGTGATPAAAKSPATKHSKVPVPA